MILEFILNIQRYLPFNYFDCCHQQPSSECLFCWLYSNSMLGCTLIGCCFNQQRPPEAGQRVVPLVPVERLGLLAYPDRFSYLAPQVLVLPSYYLGRVPIYHMILLCSMVRECWLIIILRGHFTLVPSIPHIHFLFHIILVFFDANTQPPPCFPNIVSRALLTRYSIQHSCSVHVWSFVFWVN